MDPCWIIVGSISAQRSHRCISYVPKSFLLFGYLTCAPHHAICRLSAVQSFHLTTHRTRMRTAAGSPEIAATSPDMHRTRHRTSMCWVCGLAKRFTSMYAYCMRMVAFANGSFSMLSAVQSFHRTTHRTPLRTTAGAPDNHRTIHRTSMCPVRVLSISFATLYAYCMRIILFANDYISSCMIHTFFAE